MSSRLSPFGTRKMYCMKNTAQNIMCSIDASLLSFEIILCLF